MIYIIGLGSNIPSKYGDKLQTLKFAMLELEKNNIKILKKSYLYSSAPQNFLSAADNFINAAIMVETIQKPLILLNCLKKIERMTGRNAYKKNTSRTCDLDILMAKPFINFFIKDHINYLEIPHPKLIERDFVLRPMSDICPNWVHVKKNSTIMSLAKSLRPSSRLYKLKEFL